MPNCSLVSVVVFQKSKLSTISWLLVITEMSIDARIILETRLVNKCMSTHLNANANVSLDANAIFQERMQMQLFWGRTQMQMFWLHICKCI